jgi:hypothetical protein
MSLGRMRYAISGLLTASIAMSTMAAETAATGKIDRVFTSSSTLSDFRISVHLVPTSGSSSNACGGYSGWYSAERENLQLKKGWLASVLLARTTQATVTIRGTGTCDDYGVEPLQTIDY